MPKRDATWMYASVHVVSSNDGGLKGWLWTAEPRPGQPVITDGKRYRRRTEAQAAAALTCGPIVWGQPDTWGAVHGHYGPPDRAERLGHGGDNADPS